MPANLENSAVAMGLEKVSVHSNPEERQCQKMLKLQHNCSHLLCQQSNAQNSPRQASSVNFQMFKLLLEKAEEPEIELPTYIGSQRKQGNFRKIHGFASLTILKPLTVWITTNCGKFLKRWEYQNTFLASREIYLQVKKQQLESYMEQWTGSKLGKE